MESLETELAHARDLDVSAIADAIESVGFECTRCGACCTRDGDDPHTATVFPDEVRDLQAATDRAWRDVARPMPYGLREGADGPEGETFEWALRTDACGDCAFYEETDGVGACTVHDDRPLICATYPFSLALDGTTQPMGEAVASVALPAPRGGDDPDDGAAGNEEREDERPSDEDAGDENGMVRVHECEGLGRDISRADAEDLARTLKERAIRELEEAIDVRESYEPTDAAGVVVHDSEGQKRADGSPLRPDGDGFERDSR